MKRSKNYSSIYSIIIKNANEVYNGKAKTNALRDANFKTKILSIFFKVCDDFSIDLNNSIIVDIGCSKCEILLALNMLGFNRLTGLNLFPFDLEWFRDMAYYDEYFGDEVGNIRYLISDVDKDLLPFDNSSLNVIFMTDVLEHLHDPHKVLSECYRVLKPDGLVVISTANAVNLKKRIMGLLGRNYYTPIEEWLDDELRYSTHGGRRFTGHNREFTMSLSNILEKYGYSVLRKKYLSAEINDDKLVNKIYSIVEAIYDGFKYHLLIIGQKKG